MLFVILDYMRIENTASVELVARELGDRIAAERLSANLTQAELAEQAGVAKRTIERLERGDADTRLSGLLRVCRVLGVLERFDLVLPEPTISPMAQLKLERQRRKRASGRRALKEATTEWTWNESP